MKKRSNEWIGESTLDMWNREWRTRTQYKNQSRKNNNKKQEEYILFCSDLQEYAREVLVIMPHRISFIILHQKQQQQKKYKEFSWY